MAIWEKGFFHQLFIAISIPPHGEIVCISGHGHKYRLFCPLYAVLETRGQFFTILDKLAFPNNKEHFQKRRVKASAQ